MAVHKKNIIIIAGPTAVGKTSLAIQVAQHFKTEIISADSRQCYQELDIGVARPSPQQLAEVRHHFIASHSIHEKLTAATFEQYALEKAATLFQYSNTIVLVGGTGLYIKAFCEGLDEIPEVPDAVRNEIIEQYKEQGIQWLQEQIKKVDPKFYQAGELHNPHRLMRALEVYTTTGRSIQEFKKGAKKGRDFGMIKIALELPKEQLHQNINSRVDSMLQLGLIREAELLIPYKELPALQTVGYKELFDHFAGEISVSDAVELIKRNTRHYAKRQMTWFKKDKDFHWFSSPRKEQLLSFVEKSVS